MNQLADTAIVLGRTDYGEADRILTMLTPEHGKLRLMARGVRKIKSKLAGGIELFSVSEVSFMRGRGDMGTLVSTRLQKHYGNIVKDLDRTMAAYDFMKQVNKTTEDGVGGEYFYLLQQTFEALDDDALPLPLVSFWFGCQMLRLGGHTPNLSSDEGGRRLEVDMQYNFSFDTVNFVAAPGTGRFGADEIKFLRLAFTEHPAKLLSMVQGSGQLVRDLLPLIESVQRAIM